MPTDAIDRHGLANAISWLLAGIAVLVLDVRLSSFGVEDGALVDVDVLFDPAGAVVVALGVEKVRTATPATTIGTLLRLAAWLHVALVTVTEVGILLDELTVGGVGVADAAEATLAWQLLATLSISTMAIGVVLLAQHLRRVLTGIASDRWKQITIAWAAVVAVLPLLLLVASIELVFLGLAVVATAGVLLLVGLFATRRDAEENRLDLEFPER